MRIHQKLQYPKYGTNTSCTYTDFYDDVNPIQLLAFSYAD